MATLVIRSLNASLNQLRSEHRLSNPNAKSILIARLLRPVLNNVVSIRASNGQAFAPLTPNAELSNTGPSVSALKGLQAIHKSNVSKLVADPIPIVLRTKLALTASVRIHAFLKRAVPTPCAVLMPIDRSASVLNAMKATPTVPVVNPSVSSIMIVRARWLVVKRTAVTHAIVHQTPNVPSSITCLDALARLDIRENRTQPEDVTYQKSKR